MPIERIFPSQAPTPRGPYAPAVRAGDFIFVSGQGPIDPTTDQMLTGGIQEQTHRTLTNLKTIVEACGATLADVVKCSVFLSDGSDFHAMNQVYAAFFGDAPPARTTVEAKFSFAGMKVEIDCVVYKPR